MESDLLCETIVESHSEILFYKFRNMRLIKFIYISQCCDGRYKLVSFSDGLKQMLIHCINIALHRLRYM
jgi:hypothetical protein